MRTKLVVGVFTPSVLLAVADRVGAFATYGLDVETVAVASSPAQFRSLLDGTIDIALTSPDNVLAYRFDPGNPLGAIVDVRIVAAVDRGLGLALYGRPGLTDIEDLRGGVFGVDVPNSGFALAMYALAESLGLDRGDYRLAVLGATPRRLTALLEDRCTATILGAGTELRAEQAGCVPLARVADICTPYLGSVLAVAGDRVLPAAHGLTAAVRATARAIRAGEHDRLTIATAAEILGLSEELAVRHLHRMRSPSEGVISHGAVDRIALTTVIWLRARYLPTASVGLAHAFDPESGLLATPRGR